MLQLRPRSSCSFLAACGLMSVVSFASIASGTDLTISDSTPQLNLVDTLATTYSWEVFGTDFAFGVGDNVANSVPFRIEAGAPDFCLFIVPGGQIGMGTANPAKDVHISSSSLLPTLRFESTSDFAYTWDLEASGGGFDLIDVTNGTIPFVVHSGAPDVSLVVSPSGKVGCGIANPTSPIHVRAAAQSGVAETIGRFEISDDSIGILEIGNVSSGDGIFHPRLRGATASQAVALTMEGLVTTDAGLNPVVAYNVAKRVGGAVVTRPLVVYSNNGTPKVTIAANGNVTATSFITASSRTLKERITDLPSGKASAALRQLTPVEFVYKDDASAEPRVGFIAEDVPELIAEPDRASVPVMDVVALVTRVVKDQQQTIDEQKKAIDEQKKAIAQQQKAIDELTRRLNELESPSSTRK